MARLNKHVFIGLAFGSLILFGAIGILVINKIYGQNYMDVIFGPQPWYLQVLVGTAYGTITALGSWKLIRMSLMKQVREFYAQIIAPLKLTVFDIVFISLCAGIGEELLFRGAIQPWLGVWVTAIAFVAMHGYLSPNNWKLSIYGALMTLVMVGVGYMTIHLGLLASMMAHAAIDVVLLYKLCQTALDLPTRVSEE